jgi:hypothetical protein
MRPASSAQHYAPEIPGKPGEFRTGLTKYTATWSVTEAPYLKNNSCRIKKGVKVSTSDINALILRSNGMAADSADQNGMFLRPFFVLMQSIRNTLRLPRESIAKEAACRV